VITNTINQDKELVRKNVAGLASIMLAEVGTRSLRQRTLSIKAARNSMDLS
jgi:hypothetical protein